MNVSISNWKLFLVLLAASLILFVFDKLTILNLPKTAFQFVSLPIQYGVYQSGVSLQRQWEFFTTFRKSFHENKALKEQLSVLLIENADLRKKLVENEILLGQKNSLGDHIYQLLPARVIGLGRFLEIDRGSNDGVQVGQVVVYKDVYIGITKQVSPKASQVMLLQDPDSKTAVFSLNNQGRARGILQGQFGSELLMDKILHQEVIAAGDLVYSEGTEGSLPRGLIVGTVSKVDARENQLFKQAQIQPVYAPVDLDVVFILPSLNPGR